MFRLENVSKSFGDERVLDRVSLSIEAGATTALLGPSGSGKSTILKLLLGLEVPDGGTVSFAGETVAPETAGPLRRRIGYVVQGGGLFPHLTAEANIALMARHGGWPEADIAERVAALAEITHLPEDCLPKYPAQLSGGQAQRVALMRALVADPDVLLLDEPLGALDTIVRHHLQDELKALFGQLDKTVVLVTHDIAEAAFFADHIVLLGAGRVHQQGSPEDIFAAPANTFVFDFLNARRPTPRPAAAAPEAAS